MLDFFRQVLKKRIDAHRYLWGDKRFILSVGVHLLFLTSALFLSYLAGVYVDGYTGGHVVPDLLLDHLPTFDVGYIFFQGAFFFVLSLIGILIVIPEAIPFTLSAGALFYVIRAIFMVMTHLSAPLTASYSYIQYEHHIKEVLFTVNSGNDLFFSGHAGFPFLLALIFWRYTYLRYYFLLCSLIASVAVLLGHLHYSIDVFSAFFITYGIFEIAKRFFKKEYSRIL